MEGQFCQQKTEEPNFLIRKRKILNYTFGDQLSLKAFEAEDLDISDMDRVGIALFGPTGSGKTSFIGGVERTLLGADKQTAFDKCASPDAVGTVILERFLPSLNINLLDTRGWNMDVIGDPVRECRSILCGRTREGDVIARGYDKYQADFDVSARYMASFGNRVHGVIFVLRADDERLKDGVYLRRMAMIRDFLRLQGHSPITVITCEDKIKNDEDRQIAFQEASAATGSPIDRTFFITNYTSQNNEYSFETEKQVLYIMDAALLSAERFVLFQKLREQRRWHLMRERSNKDHRNKMLRHSSISFILNVYEVTIWLPVQYSVRNARDVFMTRQPSCSLL